MTRLNDALESRFDDYDEIRDIVNHGCGAGVSDFIYSTELAEFFNEYQDDIEDVLDEYNVPLSDLINDPDSWTFQEMKEHAVWTVVELYCRNVYEAQPIH